MLLLLILSIVAASLNSITMHKADLSKKGAIYKFNLLCAVLWCVCLFIASGGRVHLDKTVLLWGCVYGVTQALFVLCKTTAMNSGPVSVTTLIGNCSLVVSVTLCLLLWREPITLGDVLGLLLLMAGIVLTTYTKCRSEHFTKRWAISAFFFLVFGAGVGIIFKAFSKSAGAQSAADMMFVAAFVMLLFYAAILILRGDFKISEAPKPQRRTFVITACICGFLGCLYNRLNIFLSGNLSSIVFFPCFNGGVVVLSAVLSAILLREHPGLRRRIGLILGIAGICVIGMF